LQLFLAPIVLRYDDRRRISQRLQDIQIRFRIALHVLFSGEEKYKRKTSFLYQLTRNDEAIAAVVALAAQDGNRQLVELLVLALENFGHAHPGVLHEEKTRNPVFVGGETIDLAD